MKPKSLYEIRLRWSDHKQALSWLGLLYRKPLVFREALETGTWSQKFGAYARLLVHVLPHLVLVCVLGRLLLFGVLGLSSQPTSTFAEALSLHGILMAGWIAFGIVIWIVVGLAIGIAVGLAGGISIGLAGGLAIGLAVGITGGMAVGFAEGLAVGIAEGLAVGIAVGIAFGITRGITRGTVAWIVFGIGFGIVEGISIESSFGSAGGMAFGIALGIALPRYYYNMINPCFLWPRVRAHWYPFHPVAWDDCCSVPFSGLDRLLAAYTELEPEAGDAEIERLIGHYPSQRTAGLGARARLVAREAGRATDLTRLGEIVARLPEGTTGFLAETPRVREMVVEIVRYQARLNSMDRPAFREPYADLLCTAVENFRHVVASFHEPLASEFRAAAERWREVAERQRDELRRVVSREPTVQVFHAGDPVDRNREAFVERARVVGRLEQQVMLATGCPGVVLYGRRRTGKSTVLKNLEGFLPPTVSTAVVSMQNPEAFTSLGSFCELLGSRMRERWPGATPSSAPSGDLPQLARLLGECDRAFADAGKRLILALDEYENIDRMIGERVFPEDLLALVRESIQSHRNLTWVFAGSHEIEELAAAPWTSYLVSARTVEVPPFTEDETRLLLTEPLKHSTIWPRDRERPHFEPEFWGEGGVARVHSEAGGWPHLVQLLAETIVDRLNESGQQRVDDALWNQALDEAVVRGHNVFHQLLIGECQSPAELEYIRGFRKRDTQPRPADDAMARSISRRLLVVEEGEHWRLRAPLFGRWLRQRG